MLAGFVRNLVGFNQTTKFERARVQATYYGDSDAPREEDLQVILTTLSGKDSETRASSAFNVILSKMKVSESRKYWNYIVKNLIILDRLVEERYFVKDISELELSIVEAYDAKEKKYKEKMIEELISSYYRFIKAKAEVYWNKNSTLNTPKDQRKKLFKQMESDDVLAELRVLNSLSISAFDIFKTSGHGHLKYKLNQYVFLLVLNSIMNIFFTQYVAFISIVERYFEMELYMANESYQAFKLFLERTEDLIRFTGNHQFIPGFQLSLHELRNPEIDIKLLKSMHEYIKIIDENQEFGPYKKSSVNLGFDRKDMKPKRSEIDIAALGQQLQSNGPLPDDITSPEKALGGSGIKGEQSPQKTFFRNKTLSAMFETTLSVGFHAMISVEDNLVEKMLDDYKPPVEEVEEGAANGETKPETNEEGEEEFTDKFNSEMTVTPVFKKLLLFDQEDLAFDAFQCHYSYEHNVGVEDPMRNSVRPSGRVASRISHELRPLGIVLTEVQDYIKTYEQVEKMNDFQVDIFNNFKNSYSAQFKLPK